MRRTSKIAALAVVTSLALVGCGRNEDSGGTDGGTDAGGSEDVCETADGDGPAVGLAYDVGGQGDQSFNDSAYAGLKKAVEDLGATCVEGEAAEGEAESAREDRLRNLADQGLNPIIGVGFAYSESVNAVAPDYPDVSFAVIDGFDPDDEANDNVAYLGFAENEGSFLVGVAAAEKTESDHVGFVGGVNNDLIQKFEAGFVAGVEAVDPNIEIEINYIEESDLAGFGDPAGGKQAAEAEYDAGADVVYHAAGGSGAGVFEAAAEAEKWAIGVDSDQYLTAPDDQKEWILTSMLKRVDVATYNMIESIANEEPLTSYVTYDLAADGVGYSTSNEAAIEGLTDTIDDYSDQIKAGDIKVPTTP